MKALRRVLACWGLGAAVAFLCGCEDTADRPPDGPDISGNWSGFYYVGDGPRTRLSGAIAVNGDTLFVETTLPQSGHLLSGHFRGSRKFFLTDAYDGEMWSAGEDPTPTRVVLIDYANGPGTELRTIELTRGSAPATRENP